MENEEDTEDKFNIANKNHSLKIAVVRNRHNKAIIHRFGRPSPETYGRRSVQNVLNSLYAAGFQAKVFEGDMKLFRRLKEFFSPASPDDPPAGLVFNMAYGGQGDCRYTHVPAMLEMAGIPYTGAAPLGHAVSLDKVVAKILMREAGVPTPAHAVMRSGMEDLKDLQFPLIVKCRHESTSYGLRLVENQLDLREAVEHIVREYKQEALVEQYIAGREICVGLLGNDPPECLPITELNFNGRDLQTLTWEDKYHKRVDEPEKICPAPLPEALADRLRAISLATFHACHCRDYARVDFRIDGEGNPHVLEINSMASLGMGGSYVLSARVAGYSFEALVYRIIDVTYQRYFQKPLPPCSVPVELNLSSTSPGDHKPLRSAS